MLKNWIESHLEKKEILIMSHLVLGFPSLDENYEMIRQMKEAGVELVELQIPFSEPTADGPTILKANQDALASGIHVQECLDFAKKVTDDFPEIAFLFMTYCNIVYQRGYEEFLKLSSDINIKGLIVPDLPPEEAEEYLTVCKKYNVPHIHIVTPTHSEQRLKYINEIASDMVYGVARTGVTGSKTEFDDQMENQIKKYKHYLNHPLGIGFGVKEKSDVDYLKGKAEIAVIGSQLIRIIESEGVSGIGTFLKSLR